MSALLVAFPRNEALAAKIASRTGAELSQLEVHRFPDEEALIRFPLSPEGRDVVLLCSLDRPDSKFLPLAFAARTARELGAGRVGLVAPYLAFMRQDRRFESGQSISASAFARLISRDFDWLVTVDPHLHRIARLEDIYDIPCRTVHAAQAIADWVKSQIASPVIVGPDSESAQWVSDVAHLAHARFSVWKKARHGDRDVEIASRGSVDLNGGTPVLVDDIIASGQTMAKAIASAKAKGARAPVCIGVHAVFASGAMSALRAAGAAKILTTNTIAHETNAIDISAPIAEAISSFAHTKA